MLYTGTQEHLSEAWGSVDVAVQRRKQVPILVVCIAFSQLTLIVYRFLLLLTSKM